MPSGGASELNEEVIPLLVVVGIHMFVNGIVVRKGGNRDLVLDFSLLLGKLSPIMVTGNGCDCVLRRALG